MSHPDPTFDPEDLRHEEDDAASPVVDPYPSEQEMIDEEMRDKVERRRKFHAKRNAARRAKLKSDMAVSEAPKRRVISPRLPMGRHSLNYDGLLSAPGRRNREIDDGGLD
jgi:hypothetical protein